MSHFDGLPACINVYEPEPLVIFVSFVAAFMILVSFVAAFEIFVSFVRDLRVLRGSPSWPSITS